MSVEDAVERLGSAVQELDALIAHGADPRDMAMAAEDAAFYAAELSDLSIHLKREVAARELAV